MNTASGATLFLGSGVKLFPNGLSIIHISLFNNSAVLGYVSLPSVSCRAAAVSALTAITDGSAGTCLFLRKNTHFLAMTVTPSSLSTLLYVTTRYMDCSTRFHLSVWRDRSVGTSCRTVDYCALSGVPEIRDGGVSVCSFQCQHPEDGDDSDDVHLAIRVTHVYYGEVCDIVLLPRE